MEDQKVIIIGGVYNCSILNWNHLYLKDRPIIILKESKYKILALQCTTSVWQKNPKILPDEIEKILKNKKGMKYLSFGNSHWIKKTNLKHAFKCDNIHIKFSKKEKNIIFIYLKKIRKKQIRDKENKIKKYLNIYEKAKKYKFSYYKKARNELKWIIKHNINFKNKYAKIKNLDKFLKKILKNKNEN